MSDAALSTGTPAGITELTSASPEPSPECKQRGAILGVLNEIKQKPVFGVLLQTMSLASLFPGRQSITLAGKSFTVTCWRLCDILGLERWLVAQSPNPLDGFVSPDEDPEPSTRKRRLRTAMATAKSWPPKLESDEGRELLSTAHGAAFFLCTALDRDNPEVTADELVELVETMDATDWKRLNRILWQCDPQEEILREIIPERFESDDSMGWPEVVDHIATERRMSYSEVLKLTLPEVSNILRKGQSKTYGIANPSRAAIDDYNRRMLDDDEIPDWEVRQRQLDEEARLAEEKAAAESPPSDPIIARDAARLGMDPAALAQSLAELDARVAELAKTEKEADAQ